jgi:hypothetical protein
MPPLLKLFFRCWHLKCPLLQHLVPDHEAGPVPDQNFDPVAPLVQENEGIAAHEFVADVFADQAAQAIKSLTHIGRAAIQKIPLPA